jgi:hypothetical protein
MPSDRHLYDLLEAHWEGLVNGFAAVWSEGLSIEETAHRLRVDPDSATEVTLANLPAGFEGDQMPDDYDGILLIGQFGSWSLTLQVQGLDITEEWALSALSRNGGRALGVRWHSGGGYRIYYAIDGKLVENSPMIDIPASFAAYAQGLEVPDDWDIPADQGSPREEMITTSLILIGRVTGQEIDQTWLETPHTRFIIRQNA